MKYKNKTEQELINEVNILKARLAEYKQNEEKLRDISTELDIRVKIRTAELSRANESLYKEIEEHRRIEEELKQNYDLQRVTNSLLNASLKNISLKEFFNLTLDLIFSIKWISSEPQGAVFLVEDKPRILVMKTHNGLPQVIQETCEEVIFGKCLCGKAAATQKIQFADRLEERHEIRYAGIVPHGHYCVPILSSGKTLGVINLYLKEGYQNNKKVEDFLNAIANTSAGVIERNAVEEKLEILNKALLKSNRSLNRLSLTDSHTGLYNHRYLAEIIEVEFNRAKRFAHAFTVIMLDIDYFKSINDVYGHQFGDLVLKQFAKQLKKMLRRYDIAIRFGGDEFIIISPGIDRQQGSNLANRLLNTFNMYNLGDKKHIVVLKLSLAVASYPEDELPRGIDLINLADQILNKVKESGGNRVYSSLDIRKDKGFIPETSEGLADVELLKKKIDTLIKRENQGLIEEIFAFAKTIELKDCYTKEDIENTMRYATKITQALDLPEKETELIRQASVLHDLGKVGISKSILLKRSKLNKKEFAEIKKHPRLGADIIRPIQFLRGLIPIIFYHHERWDGKGYPSGLKGEHIPLGARILAIIDTYQALTSKRPYRKKYPEDDALKIIKSSSGAQFDPRIVSLFLRIIEKDKKIFMLRA